MKAMRFLSKWMKGNFIVLFNLVYLVVHNVKQCIIYFNMRYLNCQRLYNNLTVFLAIVWRWPRARFSECELVQT